MRLSEYLYDPADRLASAFHEATAVQGTPADSHGDSLANPSPTAPQRTHAFLSTRRATAPRTPTTARSTSTPA